MRAVIVFFILSVGGWGQAQSWDQEQKALWRIVEQSWVDDANETGKWPSAYVHEKVVAWDASFPVPRGKDSLEKWNRFDDATSQILEYEIFPLAIVVEGETGVVHYSAVTVTKDAEEKTEREVIGVMETLIRSDGTWKFISTGAFPVSDSGGD